MVASDVWRFGDVLCCIFEIGATMKDKSIFKKQFGPFKYCRVMEIACLEIFGWVVFSKVGSRWTLKPYKAITFKDI